MSDVEDGKRLVRVFIDSVWNGHAPAAFEGFWTEDCVNHAAPEGNDRGIEALRAYHETFFASFAAFENVQIEVIQQVAEGDRVVTHLESRGRHAAEFLGIPPTGRVASMNAIRIDRLRDGKIAEHWSVSDVAGLMQQLRA